MATKTVQQWLDDLSPEQRDIQVLVVGAAVNGVELPPEAVEQYKKLPPIVKGITEFVVGYATANLTEAQHSDILDGELAHFGVKGMKWGVRNDRSPSERSAAKDARWLARQKVKAGTGTLGDAHDAALKSTGHRITNGVLGDKTFWKKTGITLVGGYAALFLGAEFADKMPSNWAEAIGRDPNDHSGFGKTKTEKDGGSYSDQSVDEIFGRVKVFTATTAVALGTTGAALGVGYAKNIGRAVKGNSRIRESKKEFSRYMKDTQTSGGKTIQKTLRQQGSLRKKSVSLPKVQHMEEFTLEGTLAHYGVKGQRWGVIRRTIVGNGPSSKEIKKARAVITDPAAQKGYSRRELKGLNRTARRKTVGERTKARTKQVALLTLGAAVAKEYLQINGSETLPSSPRSSDDGGMMFNPDATLDPSQVEVRR